MLPGRLSRKAELYGKARSTGCVAQVVGLQHRHSEKGSGTAGNFGIPKIPKLSYGFVIV